MPISTEELRCEPATIGGHNAWTTRLPSRLGLATPAVADGRVYVGGGFGSYKFYCFDEASGMSVWALRVLDDGPSAAVVADGYVVFSTESCTLFVVEAATGANVWSRWLGDPLLAQPAVWDGLVYMVFPSEAKNYRLCAFGLSDGRDVWDAPIPCDCISAPVVAGDSIYCSTIDGAVHRFLHRTGERVWTRELQATSAPWIADGRVFISERQDGSDGPAEGFTILSCDGSLRHRMVGRRPARYIDGSALAASQYGRSASASDAAVGFGAGLPPSLRGRITSSGQRSVRGLWEYQGSRPLVVGGTCYATQGTSVRAFDADNGEVHWEHALPGDAVALGGHLGSPPVCAGGRIVLATTVGNILVLASEDGRFIASFPVGEEIRFQPAVSGGRILAATAHGRIIAIDTGDSSLDGWTMWGGGPAHNGPSIFASDAGMPAGRDRLIA